MHVIYRYSNKLTPISDTDNSDPVLVARRSCRLGINVRENYLSDAIFTGCTGSARLGPAKVMRRTPGDAANRQTARLQPACFWATPAAYAKCAASRQPARPARKHSRQRRELRAKDL